MKNIKEEIFDHYEKTFYREMVLRFLSPTRNKIWEAVSDPIRKPIIHKVRNQIDRHIWEKEVNAL